MIRFDKVEKTYKSGVDALRGISFKIEDGEFVFIIGKSGSGKSTLMKCITCEEKPSAGDVYIDGFNISDMSRALVPILRRQIGMIYQDFRLISTKTVSENIAFAGEIIGVPRDIINDTVQFVLNIVGLKSKAHCYPDELSGGEQQRVAIARALFNNPQLIVADEPTGNLDPETSENIMALLSEINKSGTTVLICTHDSNLVDRMRKRVIEIDQGLIIRDEYAADYSGKHVTETGFGGYEVNKNEINDAAYGDEEDTVEPVKVIFGDEEEGAAADKARPASDIPVQNKVQHEAKTTAPEVPNATSELQAENIITEIGIEELEEYILDEEKPDEAETNSDSQDKSPTDAKSDVLDIPEVDNGWRHKNKERKKKSIREIMDNINSDIDILEDDEE